MKKSFLFLFLSVLTIIASGCSNSNNLSIDRQSTVNVPNYKIVDKQIENGYKRISLRVVTEPTIDKKGITTISEQIAEEQKKESNFTALNIFFYDKVEDSGSSYTIGKVVYAPNGDWAEWSQAYGDLGNYDNFKYNIYYGSAF